MAFDRMPRNGEICRHLDGDHTNNNYKNLKWGTHKENSEDTWKVHKTGITPNYRGGDHPSSKLTNEDVISIRKLYLTGNFRHEDLAEKYGVSRTHITNVINRKDRVYG